MLAAVVGGPGITATTTTTTTTVIIIKITYLKFQSA